MSIESGAEAIIVLLYAPGNTGRVGENIRGITRLDKILFLVLNEEKIWGKVAKDLQFEPYDYGPYSNKLYDYVELLKDTGLVEVRRVQPSRFEEVSDAFVSDMQVAFEGVSVRPEREAEIYGLSEKGMKLGERLYESMTPREREAIERIKKKFNATPLERLLQYVYTKFPEYASRSRIREKILGESRFGSKPGMKPFIREEEDFRV